MQRYIFKIIFVLVIIMLFVLSFFLFFKKDEEEEVIYLDSIYATASREEEVFAVGVNNNNEHHYTKAKIARYNEKQEKVWEKLYNKGYDSEFLDVGIDQKEIIAVGYVEESKKDHKNNHSKGLLLKYDLDGNLVYEKTYHKIGYNSFSKIVITSDGYYVIGTGRKNGREVGILLKYQRDGKLAWDISFEEGSYCSFSDMVIYQDYIYVVGNMNASGILLKYNLDGELISKVENTDVTDYGFSSICASNQHLVVSGAKRDSKDPVLIRYNLDLEYVNDTSYDTDYPSIFTKVTLDHNQDLVVLGSSVEDQVHYSFIGKYRNNLDPVQVVDYHNDTDDYFTDIVFIHDTYLVSCYSYYSEQGYLSKFLNYSPALKLLEVSG